MVKVSDGNDKALLLRRRFIAGDESPRIGFDLQVHRSWTEDRLRVALAFKIIPSNVQAADDRRA
jgi:hypothetical protein